MCYAVYIGTNAKQKISGFEDGEANLYITNPGQDGELTGLRRKFSKQYIYYIGSYEKCSCGFAYDPNYDYEDDDRAKSLNSVTALLDYISQLTMHEDIEYYCCWQGDWRYPVETNTEIDITQVTPTTNYFGLKEKQFIVFKQQPKQ